MVRGYCWPPQAMPILGPPATAVPERHRELAFGMGTLRAALKRRITLLAWHTWQRLDSIMPRSVRYLVATAIGEVLFWILPAKRAAVLANMAQVLGPEASPAAVLLVARRSFRNFSKYLSEFAHLPRWSAADLEYLMTSVRGWQHIED